MNALSPETNSPLLHFALPICSSLPLSMAGAASEAVRRRRPRFWATAASGSEAGALAAVGSSPPFFEPPFLPLFAGLLAMATGSERGSVAGTGFTHPFFAPPFPFAPPALTVAEPVATMLFGAIHVQLWG
mmetsp:Transcript_41228/g.101730  ORF Transcript_41228/g.101730 Transcript_41228/m.101730 type:complete len:130 (+) Transcript_41228:511-900(+)